MEYNSMVPDVSSTISLKNIMIDIVFIGKYVVYKSRNSLSLVSET